MYSFREGNTLENNKVALSCLANALGATKNYLSGIEYSGANLEAIYFSEGRCTPDGSTAFFYEYTIKDHLGNARVNFRAGAGASLTALENNHSYPFGLQIKITSTTVDH